MTDSGAIGKVPRVRAGAYVTGLFDSSTPGSLSADGQKIQSQLQASTMTDLIYWAVHISETGDLNYNDVELVKQGQLCQSGQVIKTMIDRIASGNSSLTNVWFSLIQLWGGTYTIGDNTYNDILVVKQLLDPYNPASANFFANLKVLQSTMPHFAGFDFDFENPNGPAFQSTYTDLATGASASVDNVDIIADLTAAIWQQLGCPVTYCPYETPSSWISAAEKAKTAAGIQPVVGFNVQCYAGGGGNATPQTLVSDWVQPVVAAASSLGLTNAEDFIWPIYANETSSGAQPSFSPSGMKTNIVQAQVRGASVWQTGAVVQYGTSPTLADYATAIAEGIGPDLFETVPDVAQYAEADWSGELHRIDGATLDEAYAYAVTNEAVSFFFQVDPGCTMVLPGHGTFNSGDAVFFSGSPHWGSATGLATGYAMSSS